MKDRIQHWLLLGNRQVMDLDDVFRDVAERYGYACEGKNLHA